MLTLPSLRTRVADNSAPTFLLFLTLLLPLFLPTPQNDLSLPPLPHTRDISPITEVKYESPSSTSETNSERSY